MNTNKLKLKFIFILGTTEIGGAEKQAILLGNELQKIQSYKVFFILFGNKTGKAALRLEKLGIPYRIQKMPDSFFTIVKLYKTLLYIFRLRLFKPTVLLPYTNGPNICTSLIWKYTGAKACFWNQRDEGIGLINNSITRKAVSNATCFIANSLGSRDILVKMFPTIEQRIFLVNNGIETIKINVNRQEWRKRFSFSENDYLICMVANLHKDKDHETLIRAFKKIVDDSNCSDKEKFKLLLVGRHDDKYNYLLKLSKDLNLLERTYFLNEIESIPDILNAVDISVLCTFSEGLSNVAIESMIVGVPFTGSRIDGIVEVVGSDYTAYLANPRDSEDLAAKILFFRNNQQVTKELVKRNKERATNLFSVDRLYYDSLNLFLSYL